MREIQLVTPNNRPILVRKRVCAYARVSTAKDAMLHSLSSQVSYYQKYIKERKQRADVIGGFMFEIKERDGIIDEFDEELWTTLLESVTITREGKWQFKFKNEKVVEV